MSSMYTEYFYPISHYCKVINLDEAIFDLFIPFIIALSGYIVLYFFNGNITTTNIEELLKTIITLLSILIGFTITSVAILSSTKDNLIQETERHIGRTKVNLYQLSNIFFIFAIFSEILTLIINLSMLVLLYYNVQLITAHLNFLVALNIFLVSHILFLNFRNITNFYFILHSVKSDSN